MQVKVLISAEEIKKRVREMGEEISRDYADKELVVVGILKGAFMFMSDLVRRILVPWKWILWPPRAMGMQLKHLGWYVF